MKIALPTAKDGLEHEIVPPVVHDQPVTFGIETNGWPSWHAGFAASTTSNVWAVGGRL